MFELRIHVNSLIANKRVELAPFVNDTRIAALASSYNTAGSFTLTQVAALPLWLSANDTVDFRIAPIDAAEVSLQLGDVLVYAIDWEDKFKIPDYTGYTAETKDIRTGADGIVYGTAGEAVRKQIGNLTEDLDDVIGSKIESLSFKTSIVENTSENIAALYTGFATAVKNESNITKIKVYIVAESTVLVKAFVMDENKTKVAESEKLQVNNAGKYEFIFNDKVNVSGEYIYIGIEADERKLGYGCIAGKTTSANITESVVSNGTTIYNLQKVNVVSLYSNMLENGVAKLGSLYIDVYSANKRQGGILADLGSNIEKNSEKLTGVTKQIQRKRKIDFGSFDTNNTQIKDCIFDGKYIYAVGDGGNVYKYNAECEFDVTTDKKISVDATVGLTGIDTDGNYLYVVGRDNTAGLNTTQGITVGLLVILDKNFNIISKTVLDWKATRCKIHKDKIIIAMQMKGFSIYDVSNKSKPEEIYSHRVEGTEEYQGLDIYENDNNTYLIVGAFGFGLYIYDITDMSNPIKVGSMLFGWYDNFSGICHVYDVYVEYPYAYFTIASNKKNQESGIDYRGVMVVDLSDISLFKYSQKDNIPYVVVNISNEDKWFTETSGDEKPTKLCNCGNVIITNGNNSICYFKKDGLNTTYLNKSDTIPNYLVKSAPDGRIVFAERQFSIARIVD